MLPEALFQDGGIEMSFGKKPAGGNIPHNNVSRREFVSGLGAALSFTVLKPGLVRGTEANSRIRTGVVGCGGRGTWITDLFLEHGGYELVGAADYFEDRVRAFGEKFHVPEKRRYEGLSGYRRLIESGMDAVVIESPPYFHPEQAAFAVDAGVHVYLAKPIAVDVPGCLSVAESGKKATGKKLSFLVDFQTRANDFFTEAVRRVHGGDIGKYAFGEAFYHAGSPFERFYEIIKEDPCNPINRMRAWGLDRVLSGDIITEQNIHTLDVASWIMKQDPVLAYGTGGKKVRTDAGNCWDHFVVIYQYPDGVTINFSSRQFKGHGTAEGIRNRMFGSGGVLETEYGGSVLIRGDRFYHGGKTPQIYREGAVNNIAAFHENIRKGVYDNSTVPESVRSNLTTVLGRTAAYRNHAVTWKEILEENEKWDAGLGGLKD